MQRSMLLVALLAAAAVPAATAMGMQEAKALVARVWLRSHDGKPNTDELAELKDANPEAYAIVKALLTKRSLGLLDPRHPTASFAKGAAPADGDDVPRGPAVFAKFATKTELAKMNTDAEVYPDAAESAMPAPHRDWLNWKPAQSSMDDDAMVKNVLGSVADLTSKPQPKRSLLGQSRGELSEDAPPPAVAVEAAPFAPAAPVAPAAPAAPAASEGNDYLDSIGGFTTSDVLPKPSLIKKSSHEDSSQNYLASFSWGDSQQKQTNTRSDTSVPDASPLMKDAEDLLPESAPATTAAPAKSVGPAKSGTALMKWLR